MNIELGDFNMGITYIEGTVSGPQGSRTLEFLVDSVASYTLLPHEVWKAIGLTAKRNLGFSLADGTRIERQISECHINWSVGDGHTPAVLGEPGR
jgi:predicted aspartyl protease